jgi:8-oxo-dGTP pyrophosphatase MutT (NUDIX family)
MTRWTVHGERALYTSEWVNLSLADVELPDGRRLEHHVVRFPRHSIAAVVIDDAERVLMLWRHRFITDAWGWEIPAGWTEDEEPAIEGARREVEEETGWSPGPLRPLCSFASLPGISDGRFHLFVGDGASHVGPPLDPTEADRIAWVPLADVPALIERGELSDGPTLTALAVAALTRNQTAP